VQWRDLHAALIGQFGMRQVEPAILDRLAMQVGAGIGRGKRHLNRVRIDLAANWMVSSIVSLLSPGTVHGTESVGS